MQILNIRAMKEIREIIKAYDAATKAGKKSALLSHTTRHCTELIFASGSHI
jgi:hypothetical protein